MKGVLFDLDGVVTDTATYHFLRGVNSLKMSSASHCQKILKNARRVSVERTR